MGACGVLKKMVDGTGVQIVELGLNRRIYEKVRSY